MNPLKPIKAVLKDIRDENRDTNTYTLRLDHEFPNNVRPGQFNMIGYPGIGEAPISFSALSGNGEVEHTIRAVGMATRFIEKMEKGSSILIRGPYGNGWPMERAQGKDLLLVAGGIGLAPLRPVIRTVMKQRSGFGRAIILFGARNERGLIYTDEFKAWQEAKIDLQITVDELLTKKQWKHNLGLITALVEKGDIHTENTIVFVCGPEIMMRFVCRALQFKGLPASSMFVSLERRMKCGIGQCGHCQHAGLFVCRDGPVFPYSRVEGLYDGLL